MRTKPTLLARTIPVLGLLGILSILLAGCGGDYQAPPPQPVDSPPSLSGSAPIVRVSLSDDQARELNIELHTIRASDEAVSISIAGEVTPSPDAFAIVSAPISGRIAKILAHEGEPVRRGQVVAYIESLEFASIVSTVIEAKAQADLDLSTVERYRQLVDEGISPRARLLAAEADFTRSQALYRAARARLSALGIGEDATTVLAASARPMLAITTPISGKIDRHRIDLGQAVSAYDELLTVVGEGEVLVRGLASPGQARMMKPGNPVVITATSGDTLAVRSSVTSIGPAVDSDARAVIVNIRTKPEGLRPGQAVRVAVETDADHSRLLLPIAALSYNGDNAVAFVRVGPNLFEQRSLRLDATRTDVVPVLSGLSEGEEVAVSNVYDLKALARFELYGEE